MYAGEAEFEACQSAMARQRNVEIKHTVIRNLGEDEAHRALWQAWDAVKSSFDMFAKIDGDTILVDDDALRRIWDLFAADPDVTGVQVQLHDYFTDELISGLNFFSPVVEFKKPPNRLLCDRVDTNHKTVLKGDVVAHLAPIGYHCKAPHPLQAFHFGLHRMFKKQTDVIAKVARVYLDKGGEGRMWALGGAMSASFWMRGHYDYNDAKFTKAFEKLQNADDCEARIRAFAHKRIKQS